MSNQMRWRYGETSPVMLAVDPNSVIEIGDLVYQDTSVARPASEQADLLSTSANQAAFHDAFAGVAMQASRVGDAAPIRVAVACALALAVTGCGGSPGTSAGLPHERLRSAALLAGVSPPQGTT